MPSRARLASLGLTEWYELGNSVVVTNDIADANVTGAKLKDVYTANILESGNATTGNIYFSNTRAIGALKAGNGIIINANGMIQTDLSNSDVLVLIGTSVLSNIVNGTNVLALANLYAPNDVTLGNVNVTGRFTVDTANATTINVQDIFVDGNLTGNLGLTTDDVTEGSNLYFTNTRAIGSLTGGDGIVIEANGLISANANISGVFDSLTVTGDMQIDGNLTIGGNTTYLYVQNLEVEDNMIYLNANSNVSNPDIGFAGNYNDGTYAHTGLFRDADDGIWKFFDGYEPEPDSNIYIDTANATFNLANVQATTFIGNLSGNVIGLTTDWIPAGANLYFTNALAIGSLTAGDGITIEANGLIIAEANAAAVSANTGSFDNLTANNLEANTITVGDLTVTGTINLTTSNIAEGSNLYFTNTRAIGAFTAGDYITIEANGLVIGQPGYTDENAYANAQLWFANVTTDDITEGTNLYFTNARALAAVSDNITTDNVIEGANLYFTNTRAVGSLTAGEGILIEANGLISSSGEANVAVLISSETYVGDGSNTDFIMGTTIPTPESVLVLVNGVGQLPSTDYTVSGNTLSFTSAPIDQANIEVRFFGTSDVLIDARGYFSKTIDGGSGYAVTNTFGSALTVPLGTRYILHSLFVTNIDDSLTGNVAVTATIDQYMLGSPDPNTNVYIGNALPIDHRMSVELLKKPQILNAGDKVSMQALKDGVGANSNVHAYLVYETRSDVNYFGSGVNIGDLNNHILFDAGGNKATVENVRIANYGGSTAAATVTLTDASNTTVAYFCYNFVVPVNTTVELLENPKFIPLGGRIMVSASAPNAIAVSVSGRKH